MASEKMNFDIVIATCNRLQALELSIPLILTQSRLPKKMIVADASDNHAEVKKRVEQLLVNVPVELEVIEPERGLTIQRNTGLMRVESEVVFFPDDDSMFHPETCSSIMEVYEMDKDKVIGGVCAAESLRVPEGMLSSGKSYDLELTEKFKQKIAHTRTKVEQALFPDPFILHGRQKLKRYSIPDWFRASDVVPVEYMTGFRMTYLTDVIRQSGFDETLKGYGLFEDVDASFGVINHKLLVGARRAEIYHHKFPSPRGGTFEMGFTQILNRAYVICKHTEEGAEARNKLEAYADYKIFQYALKSFSKNLAARHEGARVASQLIYEMLSCPSNELSDFYKELIEKYLS